MIATGTDIKPVEIVMFMRSVKSRSFFEQMKGRGVRVINPADLQAVTPDARSKDHFVIVDAVGVCERDKTDSRPMDQKKSVPLDKLLQAVALGNVEPEVISSVAARLARLDRDIGEKDRDRVIETSGGYSVRDLSRRLVDALHGDFTAQTPSAGPADEGGELRAALAEAARPLSNPALRDLLLRLRQQADMVVDTVTADHLIEAGFGAASDRARSMVETFESFIARHRDEITALQILYNRPTRAPLTFEAIRQLADSLQAPPYLLDESALWQAYAALDRSKVKGASRQRILTDLVSLVRYAMHQDNELVPYPERVAANFKAWLGQQHSPPHTPGMGEVTNSAAHGRFTAEQQWWLERIAEHIAASLDIRLDDFDAAPFNQRGGLARVHQLFGAELPKVIEELNRELVA